MRSGVVVSAVDTVGTVDSADAVLVLFFPVAVFPVVVVPVPVVPAVAVVVLDCCFPHSVVVGVTWVVRGVLSLLVFLLKVSLMAFV